MEVGSLTKSHLIDSIVHMIITFQLNNMKGKIFNMLFQSFYYQLQSQMMGYGYG